MKHLARLLRSGAITPQTYVEGLSDLAETPPTPAPRKRREPPTPAPRQRRERPIPAPRQRRPILGPRDVPTAEMDTYIEEILSEMPGEQSIPAPRRRGLSRPRASWCSAGLAWSSAHSCEDSRWMCIKGTPTLKTPGPF